MVHYLLCKFVVRFCETVKAFLWDLNLNSSAKKQFRKICLHLSNFENDQLSPNEYTHLSGITQI